MANIIAETERLILREIGDTDIDYVFQLTYDTMDLSEIQYTEEFVKLYRKAIWEEATVEGTFNTIILLRNTKEFVGKVCMQYTDSSMPELGIDILKKYQNNGYGPEAIIAFCNWYGYKNNLDKVKVRIRKKNLHSIHVFEKLGAEFEADTSYFNENTKEEIKKQFANELKTRLDEKTVNDYILKLPINAQRAVGRDIDQILKAFKRIINGYQNNMNSIVAHAAIFLFVFYDSLTVIAIQVRFIHANRLTLCAHSLK